MSQENRMKEIYHKYAYANNARFYDIRAAYNLALKHVRDVIEESGEGEALRMLSNGQLEAPPEEAFDDISNKFLF